MPTQRIGATAGSRSLGNRHATGGCRIAPADPRPPTTCSPWLGVAPTISRISSEPAHGATSAAAARKAVRPRNADPDEWMQRLWAVLRSRRRRHVRKEEPLHPARYAVRACRRLQDRRGRSRRRAPRGTRSSAVCGSAAVCSCEYWREPASSRVRLDPLDPKTARHMGACEYKGVTEPDVIKVLLRTTEKDGYWWVE